MENGSNEKQINAGERVVTVESFIDYQRSRSDVFALLSKRSEVENSFPFHTLLIKVKATASAMMMIAIKSS